MVIIVYYIISMVINRIFICTKPPIKLIQVDRKIQFLEEQVMEGKINNFEKLSPYYSLRNKILNNNNLTIFYPR